MKRKKVVPLILAVGIATGIIGQPPDVEAKEDIRVHLNNVKVEFAKSQKPKIFDGVTYIPVHQLFEEMGAAVSWNVEGKKRFVKVERDGVTIVFPEGNYAAIVNGKEISVSEPLKLVNIRAMIPLRYVSETLGAEVTWYNKTKTVTIMDPKTMNEEKHGKLLDGNNYVKIPKRDGSIDITSNGVLVATFYDFGSSKRIIIGNPGNMEHRLVAGELAMERGFPMTREEFASMNRDSKLFEDSAQEHKLEDVIYTSYIQGGPGYWVVNWKETSEKLSFEMQESNHGEAVRFVERDGHVFGVFSSNTKVGQVKNEAMYNEKKGDPYNAQKREVFASFLIENQGLPIEREALVDFFVNPDYQNTPEGDFTINHVIMPEAPTNTTFIQVIWNK